MKKILKLLKILIGALVIAGLSCVAYFGLYELMLQIRISDLNEIRIVILVFILSCIIPVSFLIVNIIAYFLCKKKKYVSPYHCKIMLLISLILYGVFGYFGANAYCKGLAFDEGLGFVIVLVFSLIVAVLWGIILVGLIVCERISKKGI